MRFCPCEYYITCESTNSNKKKFFFLENKINHITCYWENQKDYITFEVNMSNIINNLKLIYTWKYKIRLCWVTSNGFMFGVAQQQLFATVWLPKLEKLRNRDGGKKLDLITSPTESNHSTLTWMLALLFLSPKGNPPICFMPLYFYNFL